MRRSVLVKVPSFSRLGLAGRITSAKRQVSAEEDLLHDKEIELRQRIADIVGVRVDQAHLFAEDIHRLEAAVVDGVDHQVVIEARLRRQRDIPRLLELGANRRIVHLLVAREEIRHRAVIARSLHVVMSAQRICARSRPHVVAGRQQQIRDRRRGVGTHDMLRNAHGPENADAVGLRDHVGNLGQGFDGQSAALAGHFEGERLEALSVFLGAIHPLIDKCLVGKSVVEDVAW